MENNMKERNFVAKHMKSFCHATVEVDRKKKSKIAGQRKMKHKSKYHGE